MLSPRDFAKAQRELARQDWRFLPEDDEQARMRKARNLLYAQKVWERANYGPLADVRELIALRLAPWLRPHAG